MNLIKLKTLSTKKQIYLNVLLFFIFLILSFYFLFFSTIKEIKTLKGDIITEKLNLFTNTQRQKNIGTLTRDLKKIEPQLSKFNQIFINEGRELDFINALENIADKNSVSQDLNLLDTTADKKAKYIVIPININAQGSFDNLINYLADLESAKYYINIIALDFSQNGNYSGALNTPNEKKAQNISLAIKAKTYWKLATKE